jgi:hypothetical protein
MWQSIDTAPRDGTDIIACKYHGAGYDVCPTVAWWEGEKFAAARSPGYGAGWFSQSGEFVPACTAPTDEVEPFWTDLPGCQPTHWMPMPEPPE